MKTANELEGLDMQATDAENEFWIQANDTIQALIGAKGKCVDNVYYVNVEKLFGKEPAILHTYGTKNFGTNNSRYVNKIYSEDGFVSIVCDENWENALHIDSFRRSDVVRLARLLEKYHA